MKKLLSAFVALVLVLLLCLPIAGTAAKLYCDECDGYTEAVLKYGEYGTVNGVEGRFYAYVCSVCGETLLDGGFEPDTRITPSPSPDPADDPTPSASQAGTADPSGSPSAGPTDPLTPSPSPSPSPSSTVETPVTPGPSAPEGITPESPANLTTQESPAPEKTTAAATAATSAATPSPTPTPTATPEAAVTVQTTEPPETPAPETPVQPGRDEVTPGSATEQPTASPKTTPAPETPVRPGKEEGTPPPEVTLPGTPIPIETPAPTPEQTLPPPLPTDTPLPTIAPVVTDTPAPTAKLQGSSGSSGPWTRNLYKYPYFSVYYPFRRFPMQPDPDAWANIPGIRLWPNPENVGSPLQQLMNQ